MTAVIRPYQDGDQAGLAAIIDDATPPLYPTRLHALHGRDEDGHRWKRTRVAVAADGTVAGGLDRAPPDLPSAPLLVGLIE